MAKPTRIFFVADLHGSAICWRKFINAARVYRADVLLVGGDIAAKTLTPIVEERGSWSASVEGQRRSATSLAELERLEASLRDAATVPFRTNRTEWEELRAAPARMDDAFERRALEELRRWLDWARERLGASPPRLCLGLGNDDLTSMEAVIERDDLAELTDREVLHLDDRHELLTLAYSNPTPWQTRRELSEEAIAREIDRTAATLERPASAIFNLHVPPHGTPLDLAPRLDAELTKIMRPGGEAEMVHVGSTAVRAALERHHPLLGLHGHIHESRGTTTFGRTLSVNCGSAYTEGALLGAVVDVAGDSVRSAVLTSG
ncbi:MAG: metallophosphoesterase family protein [Thermoplasmata archaeon]